MVGTSHHILAAKEEYQSTHSISNKRIRMDIQIEGNPESFTEEEKRYFLSKLALILDCSPDVFKIFEINKGSIILEAVLLKQPLYLWWSTVLSRSARETFKTGS
jgi:hypothetical protein